MAIHPAYLSKPMYSSRTLAITVLCCIAGVVAMMYLAESHRSAFPRESELVVATGQLEHLRTSGGTSSRRGGIKVSRVIIRLRGHDQDFQFNPPRDFADTIRTMENTEDDLSVHFLPSTRRVFRITSTSGDLMSRDQARAAYNQMAGWWLVMALFFAVVAALAGITLITRLATTKSA